MYTPLYEKITDALVKEGYVVLEDFLDEESYKKISLDAKSETLYKAAGISAASSLHQDRNRRRDKIVWLEDSKDSGGIFLEFARGLQKYLNRSLYLGLSYYEAHFALYEKGDFYEKHLDAFKGSKNRVVTTVYYLNETWSKEDGGELLIYDEEDKFLREVIPKANTFVLFLSDKFPHEVLAAKKKRYSIAGWFRIDKRES